MVNEKCHACSGMSRMGREYYALQRENNDGNIIFIFI
jgi:hypothetical protein